MKYQILTYNQISPHGLHRFPGGRFTVGKTIDRPDAIVLRSHDLRSTPIPPSVKAIGRAGSGTNNIPVADMIPTAAADELKKHENFVARMVAKGYTEKQVRLLAEWYLRVRKAS